MKLARLCLSLLALVLFASAADTPPPAPDWAMNATIIEACSCPMFCQCFFAGKPAEHTHNGHAEHYCLGNIAYHVNRGTWGATKLDGVKFWMTGDLGADFSKGVAEWGIVTFDPSVTKEQRDGVLAILPKIYPLKWKSLSIGKDAPIEWNATKSAAVAKLDGGKAAEIELAAVQGMTSDPVTITNLRYVAAPRNDGFNLMPNKIEAYHLGEKAFEFRGTNGFTVTIDINSKDVM
jgi:hypothetical protein